MDANNDPDLEFDKSDHHTPQVIEQLTEFFNRERYPREYEILELAENTGLNACQIASWFINRRTNGKVNQVEQIEIFGSEDHPLYEDSSSACELGVSRWFFTLERMLERDNWKKNVAVNDEAWSAAMFQKRMLLTALSNKMVKKNSEMFRLPPLPYGSFEHRNSRVRLALVNDNNIGINSLFASTSIWLPLPLDKLFQFILDAGGRGLWDSIINNGMCEKLGSISTGSGNGNLISVIGVKLNDGSNYLLQESSIDPNGAFVVFTSMARNIIDEILFGEEEPQEDVVPIIPSGLFLSRGGSGDDGGPTLLTIGSQLVPGNTSMEVAARTLIKTVVSTIEDINRYTH